MASPKPREVFEICHARYVEISMAIDASRVTAINPAACANTPPRVKPPRPEEYMADFYLAGKAVLSRNPRWKGRLRLFDMYFCKQTPYRAAVKALEVPPGTFDYWASEIKKHVGIELRQRGLFPPSRYFRQEPQR